MTVAERVLGRVGTSSGSFARLVSSRLVNGGRSGAVADKGGNVRGGIWNWNWD